MASSSASIVPTASSSNPSRTAAAPSSLAALSMMRREFGTPIFATTYGEIVAGISAERDLAETKCGRRQTDRQVANRDQPQPAAERRAIDPPKERFGQRVEQRERLSELGGIVDPPLALLDACWVMPLRSPPA